MAKAPRRARLEYHRSHLLYYRKHNGRLARAALRLLLAGRGAGLWLAGRARGDEAAGAEAAALLRLAAHGAPE
jgi:hypothetical protein